MRRMAAGIGLAAVLMAVGAGAARAEEGVVQYHADAARSGRYKVPGLTAAKVRAMRPEAAFRAHVAGPVYAAPLYAEPPGGRAMVIVATERNGVEALDAASGAVIWRTVLGPPAPLGALPCGDIDPMGITGTPVIDAGVLYAAAMVRRGEAVARQMLFALGMGDGRVRPGWPVDVRRALAAEGRRFIGVNQGQRSALSVAAGRVFVPYAGHFGDCQYYHGWVVGGEEANPAKISGWETAARGGGIWAPGGMVSDGQSFFVATGNTMDARRWGGGEAVIRLGLDGKFSGQRQDFFAPTDWRALDRRDLDLGATNPMLVGTKTVLALGKDGNAYLLDRQNLGGIGGALAVRHVSRVPIRTAPAPWESGGVEYVAFQGEGVGCPGGRSGDLVALRLGPGPRIGVAWCAAEHGRGAPIVTTAAGGADAVVWAVGAEGDERLRAFRASDGEVLFASRPMGLVRRFETPVVGDGRIYVAADETLYGFAL
ncbi:MAG: hypothetical protein M0002_14570 [Rhodospirillales bacterium]|nr:hypothetical protein [Rhodospirillales bacterium]